MNGSNRDNGGRWQPWRRPGPMEWPAPRDGHCFLCSRPEKPAASCEVWDRVARFVEEWFHGTFVAFRPASLAICKDCCIARLAGHGCEWWDLCWRE